MSHCKINLRQKRAHADCNGWQPLRRLASSIPAKTRTTTRRRTTPMLYNHYYSLRLFSFLFASGSESNYQKRPEAARTDRIKPWRCIHRLFYETLDSFSYMLLFFYSNFCVLKFQFYESMKRYFWKMGFLILKWSCSFHKSTCLIFIPVSWSLWECERKN